MPQGLEVWDASGQQTLSLTDRMTRVFGSVMTWGANGSAYVGELTIYGAFWNIVIPTIDSFWTKGCTPDVVLSGGTLVWTYSGDSTLTKIPVQILYGVY